MTTLSRRSPMTSAVPWVVVLAMVGALFLAPSSTGAQSAATLNVTPGSGSYGGQQVTFSGDMGSGEQRIFLQRRGSVGATWANVIDPRTGKNFSRLTNRDGTFTFTFPAPAMNEVYFRVHSGSADTPAHQFKSKHQDAEFSLIESNPADVPLPRGFAVVDEPFRFEIDTVATDKDGKPTRPVLAGRQVTLQVRNGLGAWQDTPDDSIIGRNGKLSFPTEDRAAPTRAPEVYRVVMDEWIQDGDRVGWFPSLPFHLEVVNRPKPVTDPAATATASSVSLSWTLPIDSLRSRIVIARAAWGVDPDASKTNHRVAEIPGTATSHVDTFQVDPGTLYNYAIYTRSADGVYTRVSADISVRTLDPRGEG